MSDKCLFKLLRENYRSIRGRLTSRISLRTLKSIKFVHFEMYQSLLVDVRRLDDIPPPDHVEYCYTPAPPEIIPPIGERHLLHLFQHPDCADEGSICLDRFPKKLKEKLWCKEGVNPGWGLLLLEDWDWKKIWMIAFVMFGLGSLLIAVLWSVYGHSIQNAFVIATYVLALGTITIGALQASLVM